MLLCEELEGNPQIELDHISDKGLLPLCHLEGDNEVVSGSAEKNAKWKRLLCMVTLSEARSKSLLPSATFRSPSSPLNWQKQGAKCRRNMLCKDPGQHLKAK